MHVITLLNEKGGVGKTTLATHIAAGLAVRGRRVVLVDSDAQGHATTSFGLPKAPGLYNLLVRDEEWKKVLIAVPRERWTQQTPSGELLLLPSNVETRAIMSALEAEIHIFGERLNDLRGWADVVIIDTAPTPSLLHSLIYLATDMLLYPTQCERLSLDGLAESVTHKNSFNTLREKNGLAALRIAGVQPVMYRATRSHELGLRYLLDEFRQMVWPALPISKIWSEAGYAGEMLFAYAPKHGATRQTWALVERVEKAVA